MSDAGKLILKFIIVLVIFPTMAHLTTILSGFVLMFPALLLPKGLQEIWFPVVKVATIVIGLLGGFLFSRRIWPREAAESGDLSAGTGPQT